MGTNLFFEVNEIQQPQQEDNFETKPSVKLEHIFNQTKIINLHPVKVRPKRVELPQFQDLKYNFNWDYNTLLDKFANGSLNLEDIVKQEDISIANNDLDETDVIDEPVEKVTSVTEEIPHSEKMETSSQSDLNSRLLENNYLRLSKLARRPTRRHITPEVVQECDPKYKQSYYYHNLEKQVITFI